MSTASIQSAVLSAGGWWCTHAMLRGGYASAASVIRSLPVDVEHFFILYGEEGPHLRIRLRAEPVVVRRQLQRLSVHPGVAELRPRPYVRELDRYHDLRRAEAAFVQSTRAARPRWLSPMLPAQILAMAVDLACQTYRASAIGLEASVAAMRAQARALMGAFGAPMDPALYRIQSPQVCTDWLDIARHPGRLHPAPEYTASIEEYARALSPRHRVRGVASQVHMTTNRLGVLGISEVQLWITLADLLAEAASLPHTPGDP